MDTQTAERIKIMLNVIRHILAETAARTQAAASAAASHGHPALWFGAALTAVSAAIAVTAVATKRVIAARSGS